MVQSDFNLDTWFSSYDFFTSKSIIYVLMSSILDFSACSQPEVGVCGPYHYAIGPAGACVLHVPRKLLRAAGRVGEKGARWLLSSDGQTLAPLVGDWSRSLDCACAAAAVHDAMRVATRLKSKTKKSEQHTRQLDRIHEHRPELCPSAGDPRC